MNSFLKLSRKAICKAGLSGPLMRLSPAGPLILLYHGVRENGAGDEFDRTGKHVEADRFRAQLELLQRHFRIVPLDDLVTRLLNGESGRGMLSITFDDGYVNNLEVAAPILHRMGLPATFFLATGFIGTGRWLWNDQIEAALGATRLESVELAELNGRVSLASQPERTKAVAGVKRALKKRPWQEAAARVAEIAGLLGLAHDKPFGHYSFMDWEQARGLTRLGMDVGAHTVNHAILSRVPLEEATGEILESRDRIRTQLGACSDIFCYPNGKQADYSPAVMDVCKQNFRAALAAEPGAARGEDRYEIRRFALDNFTSVKQLASVVAQAA